jgi:hypothetical protein
VFYEAKMNTNKIKKTVGKVVKATPAKNTAHDSHPQQLSLADQSAEATGFEIPRQGTLPKLIYIDESALDNYWDSSWIADMQEEVMVAEYERIIQQQLDKLTDDQCPMDLLVLVPDTTGPEKRWAFAALKRIAKNSNVDFIDYTDENQRRDIVPSHMMRLCTFHSSRGLEGMHVVIFGIEWIERTARKAHASVENLGYIVLSRPLLENIIAVRPVEDRSDAIKFIRAALDAIREAGKKPA